MSRYLENARAEIIRKESYILAMKLKVSQQRKAAETVGAINFERPKISQSLDPGQPVENGAITRTDEEVEIQELENEKAAYCAQISNEICARVSDPGLQAILHRYYVMCLPTWEDVAKVTGCAGSSIYRRRKDAIAEFEANFG